MDYTKRFPKKSPIEHNVEHLYWKRTYLKDVCENGKSFFIDKRRSKRLWMTVQGIGFKFELSQWIDDSRNWMGLDEERQVFFVNFSLRNYHRYRSFSVLEIRRLVVSLQVPVRSFHDVKVSVHSWNPFPFYKGAGLSFRNFSKRTGLQFFHKKGEVGKIGRRGCLKKSGITN